MVALNFTLFFYQSQMQIIARLSAEENLIRASYVLQRLFSTAVNLRLSTVGIANGTIITGATRGQFIQFTYDRLSAPGGAETIVAAFHRDSTNQGVAAPRVRLTPVMISYLRPAYNESGVIFIANQNAANHPAAGINLQGSYDRVFFDKVVEFGFNNVLLTRNAGGTDIPVGLNIMIKMRHFMKTTNMAEWNFCPQWDITNATVNCTNVAPTFVDLLREVRVTMVNQVVESNSANLRTAGLFERALGNIYLFPTGINR